MEAWGMLFTGLGLAMREAALFAACGFLLLGASDIFIDAIWIGRTAWRRLTTARRPERLRADTLAPAERPGRIAIFVPAWDEAAVIGDMLGHALATFRHPDYRIYVGCYPNDPATIAAVRRIRHRRLRLVVGPEPGPTTKADCLNRLWEAMLADEVGIMYQMHQRKSTGAMPLPLHSRPWEMALNRPATV